MLTLCQVVYEALGGKKMRLIWFPLMAMLFYIWQPAIILFCFTLLETPQYRYYFPHFTDDKTEIEMSLAQVHTFSTAKIIT